MTALPPRARSRAALPLDRWAGLGVFRLQVCAGCGAVLWPPRDACPRCLAPDLPWREVPQGGRVLAATEVRASGEPYFRARLPWPVGAVAMDAGPVVTAHLSPGLTRGARVRLALRLDRAGRGVLVAGRADEGEEKEPMGPEFADDPAGRGVLVLAGGALGAALAGAFAAAGARVLAPGALPGAEAVALDAARPAALARAAARLAGRVEIAVAAPAPADGAAAAGRAAAGFLALAQAVAPVLGPRGVWLTLLPLAALAPEPGRPAEAVAAAAALMATRALAGERRGAGLRVATLVHGPLAAPDRADETGPLLAPEALAAEAVALLRAGRTEGWAGAAARAAAEARAADPGLWALAQIERYPG